MDVAGLQSKLRDEYGWRVGDATAEYVLARLAGGGEIAILASDARTGLAIRVVVNAAMLGGEKKVVERKVVVDPATDAKGEQFLLFPS